MHLKGADASKMISLTTSVVLKVSSRDRRTMLLEEMPRATAKERLERSSKGSQMRRRPEWLLQICESDS